ncbi:MAG: phosphate/phosphite/phosphonate ABC transporter substrate-binding protein [Betaproteobacteria bacterium]|nr:phosphate/phosphite/phosphonate ABC transporter substrate-binding protein [Betaproteobacteria bacterium]
MKVLPTSISLALTALLLSPAIAWSQAKSAEKPISFGIIATSNSNSDDYKKRWQPMLDELSAQAGVKISAVASANIVDDIRDGKIQVAWLSNKLALDAVGTGKMKVFAQMMKDDGSSGYSSVLLVRRESPLNSAEDLFKSPGTYKLGYGDPNSTSGYLVPNIFLFKKANIDPVKHFKSVVNQAPRANFLAVANKEVDVAVNNTEDLELFKKELPDKFKDVRVIWTSQTMPDHPILISRDLPEATRTKIEQFFIAYGADKGNKAHATTLKNIRGLSGFRKSDNTQLKAVSILEMHNEVGKVESNASLSADEKKKRLAEISSRMQKLNALIASPQ